MSPKQFNIRRDTPEDRANNLLNKMKHDKSNYRKELDNSNNLQSFLLIGTIGTILVVTTIYGLLVSVATLFPETSSNRINSVSSPKVESK